jgi:hypothetical protein
MVKGVGREGALITIPDVYYRCGIITDESNVV